MARPLRLEFAGALYHVTARGDRREDIYLNDADRQQFLLLLGQVCERFNWRVQAYCLMSNHYHLLVETVEGNLSAGMRQLNGVYTQDFNRSHGRVGHVFQGRYKGILVERETYLLELARYIVLNPVRAGMVASAADWPWSSYSAMLGDDAPDWLAAKSLLACFGDQADAARLAYCRFVAAGLHRPSPWQAVRGQVFLGSDAFLAQMQARLAEQGTDASSLHEIPRAQRRPQAQPLAWYAANHASRNEAIAAAYRSGGYTLQEVAVHFGLHYATVSRIVKNGQDSVASGKQR
ncbi:REP element-mobilizing transposase RayT [Andreprevotia lacus DSM 23236]|jgi:REP element-mobilizing transposase RayT/DNA-binding CsgD family transcriptional regulator|uniref:REP element-mobilizing transposase RayT n=1 Tax=Andreprevotia lacus DSM 23236 TaxID=1121001 RepID=A0A1W1XUP8_9NEIS|nr:transposase [Andreprevotia lacus]SMC27710.1 REP element-mobilizing transposase RayT [Andreprevotia lacus DSM 23236]